MTRLETCRRVEEEGLVPIIRAPSPELALRAAEAIAAGGISIVEITMTVPDAGSVIRALRARCGDRVVIGAGTVLDAETVRACVAAGADFIVSPGFDAATVTAAHFCGVPAMTGALTPEQKKSLVEMIPLKRTARPEEIASVVRFLASAAAGYITGQVLCVDGGMTM